jgi:hypothetical protein
MPLALTDAELTAVTSVWRTSKRELTAAFGGVSMVPAIDPGQRVLLRCGVDPDVGQIAAYVLHDQIVVHRVVARSRDRRRVLAWGDANPLPDAPFNADQIVGTVSAVEQGGSFVAIPPLGASLRRRAMHRLFARQFADDTASMERRLRFAYRIRNAFAGGMMSFISRVVRRLTRRG